MYIGNQEVNVILILYTKNFYEYVKNKHLIERLPNNNLSYLQLWGIFEVGVISTVSDFLTYSIRMHTFHLSQEVFDILLTYIIHRLVYTNLLY